MYTENGLQPDSPADASTAAPNSTRVRTFFIPLSLPAESPRPAMRGSGTNHPRSWACIGIRAATTLTDRREEGGEAVRADVPADTRDRQPSPLATCGRLAPRVATDSRSESATRQAAKPVGNLCP